MAADSYAGSDVGDCPVTFETYTERGPHQPLFLPECGHTFSRVAIERLLERLQDAGKPGAEAAVLECPLCNTAQPRVHEVASCKPNWHLIERITSSKERARQRRQQAAAAPAPPPAPPPQQCWPADASVRFCRSTACRAICFTSLARMARSPRRVLQENASLAFRP